ncbi:SRPBCC family protein [Streptomyces sp. NPDC048277]|uniref:SRPBCC family protein n=1 Tax=Streptomyces sp. NPDC048277 TaxID=3155027 RepID=UPI0033D7691C
MREATSVGSIEIAACPTTVYGIITDLSLWQGFMTETGTPDHAGEIALTPGSTFHTWNRNGPWRWRTTTVILEAVPHERLAFRVTSLGHQVAVWRYDIVPTSRGSRVTESTRDLRGTAMLLISVATTGVVNRARHNRRNIDLTLARLKAQAEAAQQS